ncbi:hypothetical protein PBI_THONKO_58 [Mycobacterium phage Thonko]|uniref:Uncharacterized protein n=1 Tax=Mycobacterium phage Thonko TaxID=2282910 RepID=A0A346FCA5_9CAUD|nr:hypothetical protein I5G57_gp058 [Mycobacterium phage Thonko]AXN53330.1 hypothetical protein PBI_THONKO_58 [Mycobacterium phage Thonko]
MPAKGHRCPPGCTCGLHRERTLDPMHKMLIGRGVRLANRRKSQMQCLDALHTTTSRGQLHDDRQSA